MTFSIELKRKILGRQNFNQNNKYYILTINISIHNMSERDPALDGADVIQYVRRSISSPADKI